MADQQEKDETKKDEQRKSIPCFQCEADCWSRGWLLLAEEEGGERKDICDNCLLFHKKVKGAERRFDGEIKPNEPKKAKGGAKTANPVKKKPAAAKKSLISSKK